jgi:O-antigen ligase
MVASDSYRFSRYLELAARISFALTVVFAPLRWRVILWDRPTFPIYGDYTDFLLYASDITLIYTLIFWGSSLLLIPRKVSFGSASIWILLAGLTLAGFVSVFGGEDTILSRYQSLRLFILFLFYLYIVNEITSPLWVIAPVGLQVLLQSLVAIRQSLLQHSVGLQSFGELLLDPETTGVSVVLANGFRFLRAYGLADHPNILGGCLAFGLVLLLAVLLHGGRSVRWLAVIVFMPSLLALVMTFSRSSWISFFIGGSFLVGIEAVLHRWDLVRRAAMVGLVGIFFVAPFVLRNVQFFGVRFNAGGSFKQATYENQSLGERMLLIRSGNRIFVEHSVAGTGLGTSPLAMKRRFPDFQTNYQPPHFTLLAAAMETGVIGATFYFLLLITPVIIFLQRWKSFAARPHIVAAFALLLTMTVVGFFDYYTWLNAAGRIWQWLAWGLWSSVSTKVV